MSAPVETLDLGPGQVGVRTVVDAPAEELFAILADPHRHHEVDGSGWVQPEVVGPRELQYGDRFQVRMRLAGRVPYRMTSTVVELTPGRAIAWQHPAGHVWRWSFQPLDDHRTLVTETFDHRQSVTARVIERLGRVDANLRDMKASLQRLQDRYHSA